MESVGDLMVAPVQPWDAIICTSRAVRDALMAMAEGWSSYYAARFGARPSLPVQLPVIPLGVDCDRLAAGPNWQATRADLRRRFGIADADVAFLFMGRLSFHAKANPLPMYRALEEAARRTGSRLHLILSGWFANESIERVFRASAAQLCPSVNLIVVDGRTSEMRAGIWSAADVFTSLSDNIQESFGLTPVEAMAAGLPAVVSDWDGYRDTVRHGIEGFMVPTIAPWPGAGEGLANRYALELDNYDHYIGHSSQFISVDIDATTAAYEALAREPDLRRRMGEAGRARAREVFDWSTVIAAYQALWAELAAIRRAKGGEVATPIPGEPVLPQGPDPFAVFRGFPTASLTEESLLRLRDARAIEELPVFLANPLCGLARPVLLPDADCRLVLEAIERHGEITVRALLGELPQRLRTQRLPLALCWMAKVGLLRIDSGVSWPAAEAPLP
jgi:glycosyltransferase involved in cell wall biosynthesis